MVNCLFSHTNQNNDSLYNEVCRNIHPPPFVTIFPPLEAIFPIYETLLVFPIITNNIYLVKKYVYTMYNTVGYTIQLVFIGNE